MAKTTVPIELSSTPSIVDNGNATAITIDSSQNVGIGTGSPSNRLHVQTSSSGATPFSSSPLVIERSDVNLISMLSANDTDQGILFGDVADNDIGGLFYLHASNAMTFRTNTSERMRIQSNGEVEISSIGNTSGARLNIGSDANNAFVRSYDTAAGIIIGTANAHPVKFMSNSSERMRIDSSGNLLVGRTSTGSTGNGHTIRGGDSAIFSRDAAGETMQVCRNASAGDLVRFYCNGVDKGSIDFDGSNTISYTSSSDYRLKENVTYDWDATTRLKQLKPARFNFISNADVIFDGFLAHEVSSIVPEAITGEKDEMQTEEYEVTPAVLDDDGNVVTEAVMGTREVPKYQGIDQSKLVPLLVKTIQELEARITALEGN